MGHVEVFGQLDIIRWTYPASATVASSTSLDVRELAVGGLYTCGAATAYQRLRSGYTLYSVYAKKRPGTLLKTV